MVSGSISLPSQGFFSPFPHGTCPLSVAAEYLALDRGRPGFRQGSTCPALLRYRTRKSEAFHVRGSHALRQAFPDLSAILRFSLNSPGHPRAALQPRSCGLGSSRFARRYSGNLFLISFPELLRWFTSLSLAPPDYLIHPRGSWITPCGLPHSVIRGSQDMCSSPRLFAACHDLPRLAAPRHPP